MSELAKTSNQKGISLFNHKDAESFVKILNDEPLKEDVLVNPHAGNSKYIPISVTENKLDELFFGLWQMKNFRWQVVANEVIGSIELGVYHPVLKDWIWREGAGAVMIQQVSKKNGGSGDITNIGDKIKNTLAKDFPHLKAQCLKNAALSLGRIFGRNLNRKFDDEYTPITEQIDNSKSAIELLEKCETPASLNKIWAMNPAWHKTPSVITAFSKKKEQIKLGLNG